MGEFFDSTDTIIEVATFLHDLAEGLGEKEVKVGDDGIELAKSLGMELPEALARTSVVVSDPARNTIGPTIQIEFPPEIAKAPNIRFSKCFDICKEGPLGVGKVCANVCINCSASFSQVKCKITITIIATF
ncbi:MULTISPECIES: hypothetical protein [unclassified Mesorhizobium]|uniref:hypothetical protein n=1 Tax=unclassified Mesorhizobium TaxID=325217 RepID=UPI000FCBA508|nr:MULTISPECIES: hypothetical protein [unclassified Mesorhizobium]RUV40027.1 hypothetical protein EOD29_30005 [Mesorhizobium sp. M1A.T.Ca.IN.004.03.1.1]RWI02626.1 MAG: hypothetical protein EOQ90_33040 [Mesorhizobium sp.]RWK75026.1 MAG: hypothetical protein EOR45_33370 [Mesorhizobium sp.]RWK95284.1 MAG: hypothetical protein EOR53_14985 [Mesorhizobium sp.]RWL13379.1 MAG: hypothetical protein EOR57_33140 [Mesorhizobium sp.]